MIRIHDKSARGQTRTGWLDSQHTFSFGAFRDPGRMGFGTLRVLNEDRIIPGAGFAPHAHRDMDILSLVLSGTLRHEDDHGHVQTIGMGEVQMMSAGRGIVHAEWNASDSAPVHLLQIWSMPDETGGTPRYVQARLPDNPASIRLAAREGALLPLGSDTGIRLIRTQPGEHVQLGAETAATFVQVVAGLVDFETERLSAGDGLQLPATENARLRWLTEGTALVFDMPALPH